MNIVKRGDVIVDCYGNYYYAIDQKGDTIRLVNAFIDLTMRRRLDDDYFEMHKGKMVGERSLELMRGHIEMIMNKKNRFRLIPLETLEEQFTVIIDNLILPE
jgi:hypothetical protein